MEKYTIGMLAKSKAGHDAGHVYVIYNVDESYVYLIDGLLKTMSKPKKKRKKHVQIINQQYDLSAADDVAVKRILKVYNKEA